MPDSVQSEDGNLRKNHISGNGRGGRFATDSDMAAIHQAFDRLPPSGGNCMSGSDYRLLKQYERHKDKPATIALDARRQRSFAERFPEAARVTIAY
jgi:hypothetical protein